MTEEFKFHSKVNGSTFVEGGQETLATLKPKDILTLKAEPSNQFDPNAIAIHTFDGTRIGYVPKDTAAKINADVRVGSVQCIVSEITGGTKDKGNVGCNIELSVARPDKTLDEFKGEGAPNGEGD